MTETLIRTPDPSGNVCPGCGKMLLGAQDYPDEPLMWEVGPFCNNCDTNLYQLITGENQ